MSTTITNPLPNPPEITPYLTEIDLPNETDRGFITKKGMKFRVKVRLSDRQTVRNEHLKSSVSVVETCRTYSISLAELDEDNNVLSIDGKLLIHDSHETNVEPRHLANPAWSFEQEIMKIIVSEAQRIEALAEGQKKAAADLKKWGVI